MSVEQMKIMRIIPSFKAIDFLPGSKINLNETIRSTFHHSIWKHWFSFWDITSLFTEMLHQALFCPAICDDINIH